jgi:endoglucanase Acf2
VFHSARLVGQEGSITRIASGCDAAKQAELVALYKKLYPEYGVHFTPDFKSDGKSKKKYDFYNKPYGLHHFLQHAEPPVESGTVIGLIDPDFIFLRPLTLQMASDPYKSNIYHRCEINV